jgi:hypothetical protein
LNANQRTTPSRGSAHEAAPYQLAYGFRPLTRSRHTQQNDRHDARRPSLTSRDSSRAHYKKQTHQLRLPATTGWARWSTLFDSSRTGPPTPAMPTVVRAPLGRLFSGLTGHPGSDPTTGQRPFAGQCDPGPIRISAQKRNRCCHTSALPNAPGHAGANYHYTTTTQFQQQHVHRRGGRPRVRRPAANARGAGPGGRVAAAEGSRGAALVAAAGRGTHGGPSEYIQLAHTGQSDAVQPNTFATLGGTPGTKTTLGIPDRLDTSRAGASCTTSPSARLPHLVPHHEPLRRA